jgi:hypothetical protein
VTRLAGGLALVCGVLLVGAWPATAACLGPSIEHRGGPVRRGEIVRVTGSGFGDACYDVRPPPPGEGYLGKPLDSLEIVVLQGDRQTVVARGVADAGYSFEVDVVVPLGVLPEEARVLALDARTGLTASGGPDRPLVVSPGLPLAGDQSTALFEGSDQRPATEARDEPERLGAARQPPRRDLDGDDTGGPSSARTVVVVGAVAALVSAVVWAVRLDGDRRAARGPRPFSITAADPVTPPLEPAGRCPGRRSRRRRHRR